MTVKDGGYYFPGEYKANETPYKEVFSGLFSSLRKKKMDSQSGSIEACFTQRQYLPSLSIN